MDYLKSGWKTVVGGQDSPASGSSGAAAREHNVADTVEKLVERVETSTLLEDRRDACRALKSLSKTYRLEVGAQAMDALVSVLQNDSSDNEIVTYALESLINIIGAGDEADEQQQQQHPADKSSSAATPSDLSIQFTEIFIKRKENVQLVLDLLPEFDFKIRYPTIKLLHSLLANKQRECQDCILTHPMGISRMMDLLQDPREVIRNDALLLLVILTRANANIQKIVAFENAFDRILEIISAEGFSDGGVVVEDCLSVLLNLLKSNASNQNFFKEGSYIQRLLPFLDIPFDANWYPQKISNLQLMFRVIRTLISPSNPLQGTHACQKVMSQSGVLQKLCTILLSNGIPAEILTETINCVAEMIRGNQSNQDYFGRVMAPLEPPKPVLVILLMSMINEKQPFELRCAVLYCFQAYLHRNEMAQAQVIETLLPAGNEAPADITSGQLLCGGLFSSEVIANWLVAVALSYTLVGNTTQKEQLLRVQLAAEAGAAPVSLLAYCSSLLQKGGGPLQRRICLLMLFSTWLAHCPLAVSAFLSLPTNIPYLTSQVALMEGDDDERIGQGLCAFLLGICVLYNDNSVASFTQDDLCKLITNRIGMETFNDKLTSISKHEKYSRAVQRPQVMLHKTEAINFDYEFCLLFKSLEAVIQKAVNPSTTGGEADELAAGGSATRLASEDAKLLAQYKELIREQDGQLTVLRKQLAQLQADNSSLQSQLTQQQSTVQQLRDQNSLLKVQKTSMTTGNQPSYTSHLADNVQGLSTQIGSMSLSDQQAAIAVSGAGDAGGGCEPSQYEYLINENRRLQSIIDQYKLWEQTYYTQLGAAVDMPATSESNGAGSRSTPGGGVGGTPGETFEIIDTNSDMSQKEVDKLRSELDNSKKELQDLLTVLGDQEIQMTRYVKKLKEMGCDVDSLKEESADYDQTATNSAELSQQAVDSNFVGQVAPPQPQAAPVVTYPVASTSNQSGGYPIYPPVPTSTTAPPADYFYRPPPPQQQQYPPDMALPPMAQHAVMPQQGLQYNMPGAPPPTLNAPDQQQQPIPFYVLGEASGYQRWNVDPYQPQQPQPPPQQQQQPPMAAPPPPDLLDCHYNVR